MLLINFLVTSLAILLFVGLSNKRSYIRAFGALFFAIQIAFAVMVNTLHLGDTDTMFFTFDSLGVLFYSIMTIVSTIVFYQMDSYLDRESLREYKLFNVSFIMLCLSLTGVYFANNLLVTWIFLEATTIATAGLVYHRRTNRSLEATWKYIFVCSVGIAIAYLGILFMSNMVGDSGDLSYNNLAACVHKANPVYLKLAFMFIFIGYSAKMEIFPLFTIGVDANYVTPTPAAALISTALVNAGFVAFFRVFKVVSLSDVVGWASSVLIIAGLLSLLIAAIYMRRTHNYKRLLAYSTVENMGIVMIGLGIGGVGIVAALFHIVVHSFLKSGLFLQMAHIGRFFGTYKISHIGGYFRANPFGAIIALLGFLGLLAFPPSGLFISEYVMVKEMFINGQWYFVVPMALFICMIIYSLCHCMIRLCYTKTSIIDIKMSQTQKVAAGLQLGLILMALVMGVWQPEIVIDFLENIVQ